MTRDGTPAPRSDPFSRALIAALLLLTFLLGCFPMADFDVWWHLASGRLILATGAIPHTDVFTYTNAGRPWIDVYWSFQVVVALLYRAGGASALVLQKALVGTATVALALAARRPGGRTWPAIAIWIPAMVVLTGRLCERPELLSLLFLASFLAVLGRAAERPRLLWLLPAIQILWVNSHGFFVLGPFVLAAYGAELLVERARHLPPARPRPATRSFQLAAGATVLACAVNPYGPGVIELPLEQFFKLGGANIYRGNVAELKTIGDFISRSGANNPYLLGFMAMLALGAATSLWSLGRGRASLFRTILFVAFAYVGWQATRNSAFFALVAAVVSTWNVDELLAAAQPDPKPPAAKRASKRDKPPPRRRHRAEIVLLATLVAVGIATVSGALYRWAGEGRSFGLGERRDWFAHDACAFLARDGMPERNAAFNLGQAAVCMAHAGTRRKQFIDPRLEVNSPETFERYVAGFRGLWRGQPGWETPLGIDYARPDEIPALLVERGQLDRPASVLAADPRWRCVHADPVAAVFVTATFADAHQLPAVSSLR